MMGQLSSFIASAVIYSQMSHGRATTNALGSHWPPKCKCLYNFQCGQQASYCAVQEWRVVTVESYVYVASDSISIILLGISVLINTLFIRL